MREYARDGFTAVIHGKVDHDETRATASQTLTVPHGRSLVVLDRADATTVCDYIRHGGGARAFLARFRKAVSGGFDPDRDLHRVGLANQTTMLMAESLEIGDMFRQAMIDRYGEASLSSHYRRPGYFVHLRRQGRCGALVHNSRSRSIIALHPEIRGPA